MNDLEEELFKACQQGNATNIQLLLDQGVSPNCKKNVNSIDVYPIWMVAHYPIYQHTASFADDIPEKYNNCAKLLIEGGAMLDIILVNGQDLTIRNGIKFINPTFLEVCENIEKDCDSLSVKYAQYDD